MDIFTVQVFPIAKPDEWREFMESISHGERAAAHREMLQRLGIKREHAFTQSTPMGDIMVLVWEGIEQDEVGKKMMSMMEEPQSDHEHYVAKHVIPNLHGIDVSAGPPPEMKKVATIDV